MKDIDKNKIKGRKTREEIARASTFTKTTIRVDMRML